MVVTTFADTHRGDLYSAVRPSRRNGLIIIWCDTLFVACAETLRRAGLSVASETLVFIWCCVLCCTLVQVYAVDWSPDGQRVASGGKDKVLKMWADTLTCCMPLVVITTVWTESPKMKTYGIIWAGFLAGQMALCKSRGCK